VVVARPTGYRPGETRNVHADVSDEPDRADPLPMRNGASESGVGGVVEIRRAVSSIMGTNFETAFVKVQFAAATDMFTAATGRSPR
jgi:hypothetical protein